MERRVLGVLFGLGFLGLLVAAGLFLISPLLKFGGPNAFTSIEERYVDLESLQHDPESREQYEFLKSWIMNNEPTLRAALRLSRTVGIAFSLLVSSCCFGLAMYLRRSAQWGATA